MPRLKAGLCPALTEKVVDSLRQIGLTNVLDFLSADLEETAQKTSISYQNLVAVERVVLAQYGSFPVNGADLYEDIISSVAILTTGCKVLDDLLDGGLYTTDVTEVMGQAAAGKTQLCLSVALTVTMETCQNVFYIDTGGSFDVQRILEMREARGADEKDLECTFRRLRCCHAFDVFEVLTKLEELRHSLSQQTDTFFSCLKLVIIDSVASILGPIVGGQKTDGHGYMMHLARAIKSLAVDFAVAVLITNNVTHDEHGSRRPTLGRAWRSVPNVRLDLQRETIPAPALNIKWTNQRAAVLVRSTRQPVPTTALLSITDKGLEVVSR